MEITEAKQDNYTVVGLGGKLDANTALELEQKILALIDAGTTNMVMDFSKLEYVSSAGLRVFLIAAKKLKRVNGKLALASVQPHVKHVFDLAGFSSLFSFYPSQQEAASIMG